MALAAGAPEAQATKFKILASMERITGTKPLGGVVLASDGNLYGTNSDRGRIGHGTLAPD